MRAVDIRDLVILLSIATLPAIVAALLLTKLQAHWSAIKIIAWSATPVPAVLVMLCAIVFINAASSSRERCGVDACGMAMYAAFLGIVAALLALAVASGVAWLTVVMRRR